MGLLIRNGEIVTATERRVADVYVDEGRILGIGEDLAKRAANDRVLDADGRYVFPGFVDPHVHMELPFMGTVSADDFETGTASGVAGGTTCIIDFVIPERGQSLLDGAARRGASSARRRSPTTRSTWRSPAGTSAPPRRCAPWSPSTASPRSRCSWPTRAPSWWTTASSIQVMKHAARARRGGARCTPRTATRWPRCSRSWCAPRRPRARVPPAVAPELRRGRGHEPRADAGAAPRHRRSTSCT